MDNQHPIGRQRKTFPYWLLLLPFAGLLWVPLYNTQTPTLAGIPFFYWYQFAWVILSAIINAIVYKWTK